LFYKILEAKGPAQDGWTQHLAREQNAILKKALFPDGSALMSLCQKFL